MKEYIEREELILNFESRYMDYRQRSETPIGGGRVAVDKDLQTAAVIMQSCLDTVRDMRSADVVERKRGEWLEGYLIHKYGCSCCGKRQDRTSPYCPNCGADMREVDHA